MGNLVDTFILSPKKRWREIIRNLNYDENKDRVLRLVGKKWKSVLELLIDYFDDLNEIVESNEENANKIEDILVNNGLCWGVYHDRYRGNCLQQVLRKKFYNTLLIVQNDFGPYKANKFIILNSDEVITEEEWENTRPEDQMLLHKIAPMTLDVYKDIKQVRTIDGVVYTRFGEKTDGNQ